MVRVSHSSTGQESWAPQVPPQVIPHRPSLSNNLLMEAMFSPCKVQLYHQVLHFTALFSGVLHHHLHMGHLWADLLKRTLAKERLILQVSPSPASGIWWWQLVQKSRTVTLASSKWVNATKTASDYCPDPTRWKGRIILYPIYYISPLELF